MFSSVFISLNGMRSVIDKILFSLKINLYLASFPTLLKNSADSVDLCVLRWY